MKFDHHLATIMLSQIPSQEAKQQMVQSLRETPPEEWIDVLSNSVGLTLLALPTQSVFRIAVRQPQYDTEEAVAHIVLRGEYDRAVSAVQAGLTFVSAQPTLEYLTDTLWALLGALAQEIGLDLFLTKDEWFLLSKDEQQAYFCIKLRAHQLSRKRSRK